MKTTYGLIVYSPLVYRIGAHQNSLDAFYNYGNIKWDFFAPLPISRIPNLDDYDVVLIHFSIKWIKEANDSLANSLKKYRGVKVIMLQDEYVFTNATIDIIKNIDFDIVYTCVPSSSINKIYGNRGIDTSKFHTVLTGYISDKTVESISKGNPIKKRKLHLTYRGRKAPYFWGSLVREKSTIPDILKEILIKSALNIDISSADENRIYGKSWIKFLQNSKACLGTESGSNLFDYNGNLALIEQELRAKNPDTTFEMYMDYIKALGYVEEDSLMNQISPRVFEYIENGSALVLVEGRYSDIVFPDRHFFSLKRDLSNIDDLIAFIGNDDHLQKIADQTYQDVILSGKYFYSKFVSSVEKKISEKHIDKNIFFIANPKKEFLRRRSKPKMYWELHYLIRIYMSFPSSFRRGLKNVLLRPFLKEIK